MRCIYDLRNEFLQINVFLNYFPFLVILTLQNDNIILYLFLIYLFIYKILILTEKGNLLWVPTYYLASYGCLNLLEKAVIPIFQYVVENYIEQIKIVNNNLRENPFSSISSSLPITSSTENISWIRYCVIFWIFVIHYKFFIYLYRYLYSIKYSISILNMHKIFLTKNS